MLSFPHRRKKADCAHNVINGSEVMHMNIIVGIAFAVMAFLYLAFQRIKEAAGHSRVKEIAAKCGATAMAALVALLGCLKGGVPAHWLVFAGLIVCTVADGVLCVRFIEGGAIFVLGHILYMIAFCMAHRPNWQCAIVFLCLAGVSVAVITRLRAMLGGKFALILAYAMILCLMVALASVQAPLFLAGAVMFAVSDVLLGCLSITRWKKQMDYVSLALYYLGQFLLGLAVYLD